jgi:proton-translocating NADH-quinone oxidoreductase chain M
VVLGTIGVGSIPSTQKFMLFKRINEFYINIEIYFKYLMRVLALNFSFLSFLISLILLIKLNGYFIWFNHDLFNYTLGLDSISILLIILTNLLILLCVLISWNVKYKIREYLLILILIQILLINVFCIFDLFLFYVYFESILIPMFLLIGIWGSRERKYLAAYQFFIYTLLGSLFMLVAIITIYYHIGSCDIRILINTSMSDIRQILICLAFIIAFAVKVPMFPVHLWLPEAHVEASTPGSVILAGILLKLGTYGILRFLLPAFPVGCAFLAPVIFLLGLLGVLYGSFATLRQVDLKKIVAYSSVAHMNFVMLGLFSLNFQGIEGAFIIMLSHGLVSSALFICVGFLYERYKTRILFYYGGIMQLMPLYTSCLFFFVLSNLSFPSTSSFVGEFLILIGIFMVNTVVCVIASTSMVLAAAYSLWFYNRISYGPLKPTLLKNYSDITLREGAILVPLIILVLIIGLYYSFVSAYLYVPLLMICI